MTSAQCSIINGVLGRFSACALVGALALAALVAASCNSGPRVDDRSYERQITDFRSEKDASFKSAANRDSPIPPDQRAAFRGLAYYPIDSAYRVPAHLAVLDTQSPLIIELQTSAGPKRRMRRVGTLGFALNGTRYELTAFNDVDASDVNRLFVPFGDLTSGGETYQGGRYIELDRTVTGLYDLDFNRAYHPFCVYSPAFECPVPPRENRLPIAIRAGERLGDH